MPYKKTLLRQVLTLMFASILVQAMPALVLPILTRYYSPHDFGVFSLYMTLLGLIVPVLTGRYDLAIMLPKDRVEAKGVFNLSVCYCLFLSLVCFMFVSILGDAITVLLDYHPITKWIYTLPVVCFFVGISNIFCSWLNREEKYKTLAYFESSQKATSEISKLFLGLLKSSFIATSNGLILGYIIGNIIAPLLIIYHFIRRRIFFYKVQDIIMSLRLAKTYKQFPFYNVPYSVIGNLTQGVIVLVLSMQGYLAEAGFFALSRSIMQLPSSLLSSSLGRVFFRESSVHLLTQRLEEIFVLFVKRVTDFFVPGILCFAIWSPTIFAYAFGETWREASLYVIICIPIYVLSLYSSWITRIFEVSSKQRLVLFLQISFDSVMIISLLIASFLHSSPIVLISIYAILSTIYHIVYIFIVMKISLFRVKIFSLLLRRIFPVLMFVFAVYLSATLFFENILSQAVIALVLLSVYYFRLVLLEANIKINRNCKTNFFEPFLKNDNETLPRKLL